MRSGGQTLRKRRESDLLTSCLRLLQLYENAGDIVHCDRLNSGKIFTGKFMIRLCRAGTPDAYFIRNNDGKMVWIETKTDKGKLTQKQIEFRLKVEAVGHEYWIIRRISDLKTKLEKADK